MNIFLLLLFIRPAIDWWRDIVILQFERHILNLNAVLAIFTLFALGFIVWKEFKNGKANIPARWALLALAAWCLLSAWWSVEPANTLIETLKLINWGLFFVAGFLLAQNGKTRWQKFSAAVMLSAAVPALAGFWQMLTGSGMSTFGLHGRIYGTFAHPNVFALFFLFLLFILIQQTLIEPSEFWTKKPKLKVIILLLCFALIAMTYTRVALVGLTVFILVLGIFAYRRLLILLAVLFALYYLIFFPFNIWLFHNYQVDLRQNSFISRLTTVNEDADSISWRWSLVKEGMPLIKARLMTGYGFGTFEKVWTDNRSASHFWDDSAEAHNDYLRLALETGLPGLALYLLFLGQLIYLAYKKTIADRKNYLFLLAWIITFAIVSFSENMLHHTPVMWLTFATWGTILGKIKK